LPLIAVGSNPNREHGFVHVTHCVIAIQIAYGIMVVQLRCLLVSEIIYGETPVAFPPPVKLENGHMT
jgi:hypothetical protein